MAEYYARLATLANWISAPLGDLSATINVPLVTALLLGLIGAASPCQLTTNVAALACLSRQTGRGGAMLCPTLAYLLGKATVYTLVGALVVLAGLQLQSLSLPIIVLARRALGPLLILTGLVLLGLVPLRFSLGQGLVAWLEERAGGGALGGYLLGVAFSLAVCPTLLLLFFGLLIPLALASVGGLAFPAVFALGTTLPLLVIAALMAGGVAASRQAFRVRWLTTSINRIAAVVLVLAGINETLVYWLW